MRRWIFAFALALSVYDGAEAGMSQEQIEKMSIGFRNTCVGKTGADMALVENLRRGQFADDQNVACYTKCIMGMVRTFKNGKVDKDMMLKQLSIMAPDDKLDRMSQAVIKCTDLPPNPDHCQVTYDFVKCNYEADPEIFFFP